MEWIFPVFAILLAGFGQSESNPEPHNEDLASVVARFWLWQQKAEPEHYSTLSSTNFTSDRLTDYSPEGYLERKVNATQLLTDLTKHVTNEKSHDLSFNDRITYEVLKDRLTTFIDGYQYAKYAAYSPITPISNPLLTMAGQVHRASRVHTVRGAEKILSWYEQLPDQIDNLISMMNQSIEHGTNRHNVSLTGVLASMDKILNKPFSRLIFMLPFSEKALHKINTTNATSLEMRATQLVNGIVLPCWNRFRKFVEQVYIPKARPVEGAWSMPGGDHFYDACLGWHLGEDMNATTVHNIGLKEVERINELMKKQMPADFNGTVKDFIAIISADPANTLKSSQVLPEYEKIVRDTKTKLTSIINVRDIPVKVVSSRNALAPIAMYSGPSLDLKRGGRFVVNTHLPSTLKHRMAALTMHETRPGHHTQKSHFMQMPSVPLFRKLNRNMRSEAPFGLPSYTAYTEGWGLYAEYIADEIGAYNHTKYSKFGKLEAELLRACRLVIDTGLHSSEYKWNKTEALEYLEGCTTMSPRELDNEINRYITWPGQACAYKIGEMKIQDLRKKIKQLQGNAFNERDFHEKFLDVGPVPLSVLDTLVTEHFTQAAQAQPVTGTSSCTTAGTTTAAATTLLTAIQITARALL